MTTKTCPHCNGNMEEVLDLYHNDWSRDCVRCGYSVELLPRSNLRLRRSSGTDDHENMMDGVGDFLNENPNFNLEGILD